MPVPAQILSKQELDQGVGNKSDFKNRYIMLCRKSRSQAQLGSISTSALNLDCSSRHSDGVGYVFSLDKV